MVKKTEYEKEVIKHQQWGYTVLEVYSSDESDEVVKYKWKNSDRNSDLFLSEEDAWLNAFLDSSEVLNET